MSYRISAAIADRLLDLLSEDDDFRHRFETNAARCLEELGCPTPADDTQAGPWCLATRQLAPKAQIRRTRDALRRQLVESEPAYNPIGLGVGFGHPLSARHQTKQDPVAEPVDQH